MIDKRKQNNKYYAFTLVEMVIVLVIIWIMLMATVILSWDQIQKVKDKTVKESILAEMQSRYSKNLWSSSFGWTMYDTMEVSFSIWESKIDFKYNAKSQNETDNKENTFSDRFEIKKIITNYNEDNSKKSPEAESISLKYTPYKISCKIWDNDRDNIVIITRVNDSREYCFEIQKENCRLIELSESKCNPLIEKTT